MHAVLVRPLRGRSRYSGTVGTGLEGLYHDLVSLVAHVVPSKYRELRLSVHQAGEVGGSSQQGLQSLGAFCMGTVLRHVLLLHKDIQKAARFYNEGLSLPILALTDRWAEFGAGSSKIAMKSVEG